LELLVRGADVGGVTREREGAEHKVDAP